MNPFDTLQRSGALRTLDLAFAQTLQRLAPDTGAEVLAGAALASLAVASGHAGLDPARAGVLLDTRDGPAPALPDPADWQRALAASRWVAQPEPEDPAAPDCPLVLEHGLLYLRRYREYERRLAQGLRRLAAQPLPDFDAAPLAPLFAQLFPHAAVTAGSSPLPLAGEGARLRRQDAEANGAAGPKGVRQERHVRAGEGQGLPDQPADQQTPDRQAQAAALALRRALLLVTGGPGTGKTTTIARLLLLRIAQAQLAGTPAPRIALAAPTGRAAERMAESLRIAVARALADGLSMPIAQAAPPPLAGEGARLRRQDAEANGEAGPKSVPQERHAKAGEGAQRAEEDTWPLPLPTGASTLHRLLGVIPDSPNFRHNADNPLPFDLIVVDEASMVDLPLMCKLVEAVADGTQLILLGDADQLPSVEAGDVLAAILQAAGPGDALQPDDAQALQPLLGGVPGGSRPTDTRGGGLAGHRVHLLRGYRQAQGFELAPLADAVRAGDTERSLALLRGGELAGVHFHQDIDDPLQARGEPLLAHWRALAAAEDPAAALRDAGRVRLLTAVRNGPQGARGLNARIEQLLAESGSGTRRLGAASPWFHGRLLLIAENSYRHGLFNGDVGICLRDESGALVAWFEGEGDGQVRGFHPAALPAHESAFAMTVHKAQGSEFDEVWLQLPNRDARVLSRELVYTGLTRARRALHLAASEPVLRAALARHAARISGLAWRLGGETAQPIDDAPDEVAVPMQGSLF
ncbi:exodeoxyribonuclease V subunit alpha [Stenotrophomonas sp. MMGLT7]|uniref:exodeoxyribonuclease V subunit alpha n=1 Tax=Stenotrophomonas sp. MMGLT7 TaxID=2901227 RepID=UPI001E2F644F|nr:exodeoxyribonuclease V subunit alpha [Stenotrophomonas sp. MMGLT7]MCD7098444.1 exodeoxyribonuclease V subunit alpha [Stenotrophomonas sp. MMGLT7]